MCRLRSNKKFNQRSVQTESKEPNRKFFFAFEGNRTEFDYFNELRDNKQKIGINNLIEIIPLERANDDNSSHPNSILEGLNEYFKNDSNLYDKAMDEIWLIFDRDIQSVSEMQLRSIKKECNKREYNIGLSNPCFEFWLLCHFRNINEYDNDKLLENLKISNKHNYISKKLTDILSHGYSKEKIKFTEFIDNIDLAIEQSKLFKTDIESLENQLGTNIGLLLEKMK